MLMSQTNEPFLRKTDGSTNGQTDRRTENNDFIRPSI